jgi:FkbM family methyltransferase
MIYNSRDIWIGRSLNTYGEYSEAEVELFKRVIKPGMVVMDVGANIGAHTVPFARLVTQSGLVVALEPERHNYNTLCGNMAINNLRHVFCFQYAAGPEAGTINVPELDFEHTVNFGGVELNMGATPQSHYPVNLAKIDDIGVPGLDFIKIDVEGMEKDALAGATERLKEYKPYLYIEDDRAEKSAELRDFIRSQGYKIYLHYPPFFNPLNFYDIPQNIFNDTVSLNLFCHHESVECPDFTSLSSPLIQQ